jgi:NAD+ diphosphatase
MPLIMMVPHGLLLSCRYVASQPWPFPRSLMVGFYAAAADDGDGSQAGCMEWLSHEGRMAMMDTGLK